ncbi:MAG TPA: hypothetical protein VGO37_20310 [Steroidobacteraceae bacterium]|jgi:hypothetical protein|nr:hypothetical protein [Steroidobacteraceae bacterium]
MKRLFSFAILVGLAATCEAQVQGGLADVAIVDRESGEVLSPHFYHGEYWVAGRPGARYAIEIHNRLAERVMAVTSVDGVNVVSGATAGWDQTGYVFSPGDRYQITGWRKSDAEVAAFTFTDSPNSYAERTGRPANVGVIGVAIFRERQPQTVAPPAVAPPLYPPTSGRFSDQGAPRASDAAPSAPANEAMAKGSTAMRAPTASMAMPVPAPKLGTGHGEREYSYVNRTEFVRMQSQPNEVIRIRYDSLDNLFAMGIMRRPRPAASPANPFPATPEPQYVPDPRG